MLTYSEYKKLTSATKIHFFDYLKTISSKANDYAAKNMWCDNYHLRTNTLPYLLEYSDRFHKNGTFFILYDTNNIVGCGGVYQSDFSAHVAIGGVRTWTDEKYRHMSILRESLLPLCKKWAIDNHMKIVMLTFNEYNKNLIQVFKRKRLGEKINRNDRKPHHLFYNGFNEIEFPINIQYTKQWAIYEKLSNWDFDWSTIKFS
jgi:hypothetical protein